MANSRQAAKRHRQNLKSRALNHWRKDRIKGSVKLFLAAVNDGEKEKAVEAYRVVTKALDQVASTSTMHKKTAARKKSRLAKRLNAMSEA